MKTYDVLSVGDINLELTMTGLSSMPVLGREILARGLASTLGGSTVNTAAGLAKLGLRSTFVGRLGRDENGKFLFAAAEALGLDVHAMTWDDAAPTGVTVSLSAGGDRAMVTCVGAIGGLSGSDIPDSLLQSCAHLHVGAFFLQKKLRPGLPELFRRAHRAGATTSLDTGWDDAGRWDGGLRDVLRETDLFFPNESEALAITGLGDAAEAAAALARLCRVAVVKTGRHGALLHTDGEILRHPAFRAAPVDTTGAGDAFNAGFLSAFVRHEPLAECLRHGLAAGSISITRVGSASSCPNAAELAAMLRKNELEEV